MSISHQNPFIPHRRESSVKQERLLSICRFSFSLPLIAAFLCFNLWANTTFIVNSLGNGTDVNPGDGSCNDGAGQCTLRAAIVEANALAGLDTIELAPGATYTLTVDISPPNEIGLPTIQSNVIINGHGATVQRSSTSGTPNFRIFSVSGGTVTINDLNILGGSTTTQGGGLNNSYGTVTIIRSTIAGNRAGDGGGIYNLNGILKIVNSTISGNQTTSGGYGGGGILNLSSFGTATTSLISTTVAENRSGTLRRGDAIADAFSPPGSLIVKNSILASPASDPGNACYAVTFVSQGYNLAGDNSCGLSGAGDIVNPNPVLGVLGNYGGLTMTHWLVAGSPAINAVPIANCTDGTPAALATDQRGISRPQGGACDIGAFEQQQVLADTLGVPPLGPYLRGQGNPVTFPSKPENGWSALANRFSLSQFSTVSGLDLALQFRPGSAHSVQVDIYTDKIGYPCAFGAACSGPLGDLVASVPFQNSQTACTPGLIANVPNSCISIFSAALPTTLQLAPGNYWLALSSCEACAYWYITNAAGGVGYLQPGTNKWGTLNDSNWGLRLYGGQGTPELANGQVNLVLSGLGRNRATGLWSETLTVTNTTANPINGPMQVVLSGLSSNATMTNNIGMRNGFPYITVLGTGGTILPGANVAVTLTFQNPSNGFINFTPLAFLGSF